MGTSWRTNTTAPAAKYGNYYQINWTKVSGDVIKDIADELKTAEVAIRGTQMDCWWYPTVVSFTFVASVLTLFSSHPTL